MIDVKKIIRNRESRNRLMMLLPFIPDETFLKLMFRLRMNERLDLENPLTFNQKLQWLKLHDRKKIYNVIVDKYEVKNYVSSLIGEKHIVKTYGVYECFDDIDFSALPQRFVIKCTHDSGGIVVCRNINELDMKKAKEKIKRSLQTNFFWTGREWPYKDIKPRILIEEFLQQDSHNDKIGLIDYKFYCFDGKPLFLYISQGLENHSTARIDFLSCNWERMPFSRIDYKHFEILPTKPKAFEEMERLAKILSKGIPFVRVDFYCIKECIYFSELTLYPGSGYTRFCPDEYDYIVGKQLNLPTRRD